MIILSLSNGSHDKSAVVADDYNILSAIQLERLSRIKGGRNREYLKATIDEALKIAGINHSDVNVVAVSRDKFPAYDYIWPKRQILKYFRYRLVGKKKFKSLVRHYQRIRDTDYRRVLNPRTFMEQCGLPADTQFFDYNHHLGHALSALFFTDWQEALLYTADGGGDTVNYSARHLKNGVLRTLYGGDEEINTPYPCDSVGLAYSFMTRALGYKPLRHEGKLTGLAAYGKPTLYAQLAPHFSVNESGRISSDFPSNHAMKAEIRSLAQGQNPEDAAASIQTLLEKLVLKSVNIYLQRTGSRKVGLAGGVFANVSLNRRIAELPGVDEVFIFPGMGDEGIAVGGLYNFLMERDGLQTWLSCRRRLNDVYWGGAYDDEIASTFNAPDITRISDGTDTVAQLLKEGNIVALYCGRMEFGPRALGARSILANPSNNDVNDTLNKRLNRTEFMPFAPVVLEEDCEDVFEVTETNRYAMRFMTITCKVREAWRDKIPAVTHVDGTARPQIIRDADNPLYADILRRFKQITGLPVLINTSFNAHEEPIIYTPAECLRALRDGRVDYVATVAGIYRRK